MILTQLEFSEEFATIKNELLDEDKKNFIWKQYSKNDIVMDKPWYDDWYQNNMVKFPMGTHSRQDTFILRDSFILSYKFYYYYSQKERTASEKQEILTQTAEAVEISLRFDLEEAIDERINNFIHYFKEALKLLKKDSYFSHIKDNVIVIKNLLNYYQQVRANKDIQLSFFSSVKLHGVVADQMLDILIAIIRDKLLMLDPDFSIESNASIKILTKESKIKWLGTQRDFVELMIELKEKNYISFEEESFAGIGNKCAQFFDFSASQRKSSSNVAGNLTTQFKPVYNQDKAKNEYFFDNKDYKRKFNKFPLNLIKAQGKAK